ncbi:DNA-(apurinic or apyrimidinic site) endonuclease 2 [Paramyrothecium foliicola]|nr:DNA-(apurinic or apyrimidinic site) endonuclease 2 [Paramyrothecium foliicola]
MGFRITTWNVNGIRNPFGYQPWRDQRTFEAMFDILEADIVVMQETKIQRKDLRDDIVLIPGWDVYFSLPRHKKGYSGVAIYTRNATCAPIRAEEGVTGILCPPNSNIRYKDSPESQRIGGYPRPGQLSNVIDELTLDSEGRCVVLEFPAFVLLGVYSPANRDSSRDSYRTGFFEALDVRVRNLVAEGKHVILTGDLNVIRSEMDSTNVLESLRKEGLSLSDWMAMPVRRIFNQLIFDGTVENTRDEGREKPVLWDLCRCHHPERLGMNTCWDTKRNTRPANNGSRIDYILCSNGLKSWFTFADIQQGLMGSDHCPVYATFADTVSFDGQTVPLPELLNPPSMFHHGKRIRDWQRTDLLPLSAKLMAGFDRRQNIRDMFSKKTGSNSTPLLSSTERASDITALSVSTHENQSVPSTNVDGRSAGNSFIEAHTLSRELSREDSLSATSKHAVSSSTKRAVDAVSPGLQPKKRGKILAGSTKVTAGQKTLRGYFKTASATPSVVAGDRNIRSTRGTQIPSGPHGAEPDATQSSMTDKENSLTTAIETTSQDLLAADRVFDAVESKEQWSKLLKKRAVPRCEHGEPCITLTTKKPGVNHGAFS